MIGPSWLRHWPAKQLHLEQDIFWPCWCNGPADGVARHQLPLLMSLGSFTELEQH